MEGRHILGLALALLGFLGIMLVCELPTWKITVFAGVKAAVEMLVFEGLWMSCVVQSSGDMQCRFYDSVPALSWDIQAARVFVVTAAAITAFGILLSIARNVCTDSLLGVRSKAKMDIGTGVIFACAGVLILIAVCCCAETINRDFYNPLQSNSIRKELGTALYIGLGTSVLLIIGGALLCNSCKVPPPVSETSKPCKKTN